MIFAFWQDSLCLPYLFRQLVYFYTISASKFLFSSKRAAKNRVSARLQLYWLMRTEYLLLIQLFEIRRWGVNFLKRYLPLCRDWWMLKQMCWNVCYYGGIFLHSNSQIVFFHCLIVQDSLLFDESSIMYIRSNNCQANVRWLQCWSHG